MQGLVLQLTRVGFLLLLWLFIWSVLRILRTDIYAPTGAVMVRRGLALRGSLLPSRGRRSVVRQLVVTEGALTGTRITLGSQPVLIGRADDSSGGRLFGPLPVVRGVSGGLGSLNRSVVVPGGSVVRLPLTSGPVGLVKPARSTPPVPPPP